MKEMTWRLNSLSKWHDLYAWLLSLYVVLQLAKLLLLSVLDPQQFEGMILLDLQLPQWLASLIGVLANILNKTTAILGYRKIHTRFDKEHLNEETFLPDDEINCWLNINVYLVKHPLLTKRLLF